MANGLKTRARLALNRHPLNIRPGCPPGEEALLLQKYRALARQHLDRNIRALFHELNSCELNVAWVPTGPQQWDTGKTSMSLLICRGLASRNPAAPSRCRDCIAQHFPAALVFKRRGYRFTDQCGVRDFCLPIAIRDVIVGIAYVRSPGPPQTGRMAHTQAPTRSSGDGTPRGKTECSRPQRGNKRGSRASFNQAVILLKLIVQYVEARVLAELRNADLAHVRQELREHEHEEEHLRRELARACSLPYQAPAKSVLETQKEQVVHVMLEYIHTHYTEPIGLQQCADMLGRRPAYLSMLFSQAVGLPFKRYLTELRLQNARELLTDPTRRISEVACEVGYADANRFRQAFKYATGLPPRAWREVLKIAAA